MPGNLYSLDAHLSRPAVAVLFCHKVLVVQKERPRPLTPQIKLGIIQKRPVLCLNQELLDNKNHFLFCINWRISLSLFINRCSFSPLLVK